jgi:hypothetical protein
LVFHGLTVAGSSLDLRLERVGDDVITAVERRASTAALTIVK